MKIRKLTKCEMDIICKFVLQNSKRYKHLAATEKSFTLNLNSTYAEFDRYNMQLMLTPDFMSKEEFKYYANQLGKKEKNIVTYDRAAYVEHKMCSKVTDLNKDIKNALVNRYRFDDAEESIFSPADGFMSIESFNYKKRTTREDPPGVYVFHNISSDLYYVGQATRLYFRVNQHLNGQGNKEMHQDMESGDIFEVKLMKLVDSPYESLGAFEREMIRYYDSIEHGYNKTKGNVD